MDLLDAADDEIDFNPAEITREKSLMIEKDGPTKGGGGQSIQEKLDAGIFDPNADIAKMSLPQQLQWNKLKMAEKQKAKDSGPPPEPKKEGEFDPNADITKMSLPE